MTPGEKGSVEPAPELLVASARALLEWLPGGEVVRWTLGTERLFGFRAAEAVGRNIRDLVGEAPLFAELSTEPQLDGAGQETTTTETQCTTKDGRSIRCRWVSATLRRSTGEPRAVVAEVEDMADRDRTIELLRGSHELLRAMLNNGVSMAFAKDLDQRYMFVNEAMARSFGMHPMELLGKTDEEVGFAPPETIEKWAREDEEVLRNGRLLRFEDVFVIQGRTLHFLTLKFPILDAAGKPVAIGVIPTDITSLKEAEAERATLREQVIASQQAALRELQTPLIPIADQVLAMPIIGSIDAGRAAQIMEALLRGITEMRAHTAILDITGVRVVNAEVAEALVRATRAARLLGARVVLTGIGPDVASALVELRVDLEGIVTRGTFQSGIAFALSGAR
jgi:PAS domain S-box-containing protein